MRFTDLTSYKSHCSCCDSFELPEELVQAVFSFLVTGLSLYSSTPNDKRVTTNEKREPYKVVIELDLSFIEFKIKAGALTRFAFQVHILSVSIEYTFHNG